MELTGFSDIEDDAARVAARQRGRERVSIKKGESRRGSRFDFFSSEVFRVLELRPGPNERQNHARPLICCSHGPVELVGLCSGMIRGHAHERAICKY